jgi:hypothetical protein
MIGVMHRPTQKELPKRRPVKQKVVQKKPPTPKELWRKKESTSFISPEEDSGPRN